MEDLDEIKKDLILKIMADELDWYEIEKLPKNDEIRTFICQFDSWYAIEYAYRVDKVPTDETRISACVNPGTSYEYSYRLDKGPHDYTRHICCKSPSYALAYAKHIDKKAHPETREAAYQDPYWRREYIKKFKK